MRKIILLALTFTCLLPAAAHASLGTTTVGSNTSDCPAECGLGQAQDWQFTAQQSETVNRLNIYLTAGTPVVGLYQGTTLKASCRISTPSYNAWNGCSIPDVAVTSGTLYRLAVLTPSNGTVVGFANSTGSHASYRMKQTTCPSPCTTLPSTWSNGTSYGGQNPSFYANNATPPPPPPPAACADGLDNDGDGLTDLADPGCSSSTDTDETDAPPPPPPPPGEPGPIAGQGYHQVFRDDFTTLNRAVWDYCIWYDCPADPVGWASTRQSVDANGILHLKAFKPYPYLNTITTQTSGKTFQYGYFECRMKWPAGKGSWPGCWLYSYQHAIDQNQCTTQAGEIDIMEGQGSEPNVFYGTVHSNTNGCAPADDQNGNNWQDAGVNLTTGFHTYAVKWTATTVTWYLDGVQTHSAPTYATDNQPMFLLLQEWDGGWMGDPDASTPDPLDNQIDYVQVWQQ